MSLLKLILSQQVIVLSLVAAGMLLVLAFALAAVVYIRGMAAKHTRRKALKPAPEENTHKPTPELSPGESAYDQNMPPKVDHVIPQKAQAAKAILSAPQAENNEPEPAQDNQEISVMKDLLSSVFTDEERAERTQALLNGVENVDIQALQVLSEQVADRLRARQPAALHT